MFEKSSGEKLKAKSTGKLYDIAECRSKTEEQHVQWSTLSVTSKCRFPFNPEILVSLKSTIWRFRGYAIKAELMKLLFRVIIFFAITTFLSLFGLIYHVANDEMYFDTYDEPLPIDVKQHVLCVIIPFRDRFEELQEFTPYMEKFLKNQNVPHFLLAINQTDNFRFNRASLINIGWNEADRLGCDYMVMNDVDLLPINPDIPYDFPGVGVIRHITSPLYHPKYHYEKFIGGILMLTMADFRTLNGMSNKYWGWGLEDDEFYLRIVESGLNLTRVSGLSTNSSNSFRHIHGPERKRDYANSKDTAQRAFKRKRDRVSGLRNVRYNITNREALTFGEGSVQVVDVELDCDFSWTPYCKF